MSSLTTESSSFDTDQTNDVKITKSEQTQWQPIHEAAKEGKLDEILEIYNSGEDLNIKNSGGYTSLHLAAHAGQLEAMRLLLDCGVKIDVQSDDGGQAIHIVAEFGKQKLLKWLIEQGADVNAKDKYDGRPIHYAIGKNHKDAVTMLLENGANTDVKNDAGITPLHYAAFYDQPQMVPLLLNYGADKKIKDEQGKTALQMAKEKGHAQVVLQFKTGWIKKNKRAKMKTSSLLTLSAVLSIAVMVLVYSLFFQDGKVKSERSGVQNQITKPIIQTKPENVKLSAEIKPEASDIAAVSERSKPVVVTPALQAALKVTPQVPLQASPLVVPVILPQHLIVGSFKDPANAQRFVKRLENMGYPDSKILIKDQMTLVSIESFAKVAEAKVRQKEILNKHKFKSWILTRK